MVNKTAATPKNKEPEGQIVHTFIYREGNRRGELVKNNFFTEWDDNIPLHWQTQNVSKTEEALTENGAARLGCSPGEEAYLSQDIVILPGHFYELKFTLKTPGPHSNVPVIEVSWLSNREEIIDRGLNLQINPAALPYYQHITAVTSKSPDNAVYARVSFEKTGTGNFDLDSVSLIQL
ncbi:MAG: hypothetical protein K9L17_09195 [Clostridiales bacterium]|nr:hypothetical protein [Clostridiales bacterium]MCF8022853.1 hypothetical protein [Clostridiales bacterium]